MAEHIAGPWKIVDRYVEDDGSVYPRRITGDDGHIVCYLEAECVAALAIANPGSYWGEFPSKKATENVVVAAPDLLDALVDCRRALEIANFTQELQVVDAAIAKATGSTP